MKTVATVAVACIGLDGCMVLRRSQDSQEKQQSSHVKFLDSGWDANQCGIRHAKDNAFKLCVQSAGGSVIVAKQVAKSSMQAWLKPLQDSYFGVVSAIEFDCGAPHITVSVYGGATGCYSGPGFVNCGDGNPIGTWLHEFGHGFACLGDTYIGGQAGYCYAGQAESIMCHGLLLNHITQDDVNGVKYQYQKLFGSAEGGQGQSGNFDDDEDGEPSSVDRCPNTPPGAAVWHGQMNGQWRGCAGGQTPMF